jgi:hypothetical protein
MAVADVWELLNRDMQGKAVMCRPRAPAREGFHTAVMLMDCAQLRHWQWQNHIEEIFRLERSAGPWLCLTDEDPALIGRLEEEWNHLDRLNERTRLLHYTNRQIQPWLTGLPYRPDFAARPTPPLQRLRNCFPRLKFHQPHVHEAYFLQLLRESLETGELTQDEVREQIRRGHLRRDALSAIHLSGRSNIRSRDAINEPGLFVRATPVEGRVPPAEPWP